MRVAIPGIAILVTLFVGAASSVAAEEPSSASIVFYLHGQIVEELGPRPVHERWGLYDYPAIVEALGATGAKVISEVRDQGTDVGQYADQIVEEIETLISGGVAPERIVVAGFSKGGGITIFVSDRLNRPEVQFVLLAACGDWLSSMPDLQLTGHVLSVIEKSDTLGHSCKKLAKRNAELSSFREVSIRTGKEHGAFYLPRSEWLDPVLDWINRETR